MDNELVDCSRGFLLAAMDLLKTGNASHRISIFFLQEEKNVFVDTARLAAKGLRVDGSD